MTQQADVQEYDPDRVSDSVRPGSRLIAEPPRIPWSMIYRDFIAAWGYRDGEFEPEHMEILGPTGSGKTYFEATLLKQRVELRNSAVIFVATKPVDKTIMKLGWPVVSDWKGVTKNRQVIYWPRSSKMGEEHEAIISAKIQDLLDRLWKAKAKVILVFDEIATSEELSSGIKIRIKRFWREARSVGITIVAMKQRPQGVQRDMHSESAWIAAFKPKDEDDGMRVAEVMGSRRQWLPILMGLNRESFEFVLLHVVTGRAVISWVDIPLKPAETQNASIYRKGK